MGSVARESVMSAKLLPRGRSHPGSDRGTVHTAVKSQRVFHCGLRVSLWGTPSRAAHTISVVRMPRDREDLSDRADADALVVSLVDFPAFTLDKHLTIVSANRLAVALSPNFAVGTCLPRAVFLTSAAEQHVAGGDDACDQVAGALRRSLDRFGEDAEFIALIGELAALSKDFNVAWARNPIGSNTGRVCFSQIESGSIDLNFVRSFVLDESGDSVIVWQGADALASAQLKRLDATIAD